MNPRTKARFTGQRELRHLDTPTLPILKRNRGVKEESGEGDKEEKRREEGD